MGKAQEQITAIAVGEQKFRKSFRFLRVLKERKEKNQKMMLPVSDQMHLTRTFRWPERYNPRYISPSSTHLLIHSFIPPISEQLFYVRLGLANGNKTQSFLIRKRSMSGVSLEDPMNKRKVEGRNCQLSIVRCSREHYSTLCPKDLYATLE